MVVIENHLNESSEINRPLVTLALFAYNQERYIEEAVKSSLSQTYSPLEIIISDDCSSDRTFALIEACVAAYDGPHTIRLNRNARNIGIANHVNLVTSLARGALIVGAAGDDISKPERTEMLQRAFEACNEDVAYIYSALDVIDEFGKAHGAFSSPPTPERLTAEWMARCNGGAIGSSSAWTRNIFEYFGPIPEDVFREDAVTPFRAALIGKVVYVDESLVYYRRHSNNIWKTRRDIKSTQEGIDNLRYRTLSNLAFIHCRLADMEKARQHKPDKVEAFARIESHLRSATLVGETEVMLLDSTSLRVSSGILIQSLMKGVGARQVAKWLLLIFFPTLYLKRY